MFLAVAVLLIQPHVAAQISFSAEKIAVIQPNLAANNDILARASAEPATVTSGELGQPAVESNSELPDALVPAPSVSTPDAAAFINPGSSSGNSITVSVAELRAENRRNQLLWRGLAIASSGAATFDAWSTRRDITDYGARELNPLLKLFAGNSSLYAAIQVGPALMDYAGKKMMYNRHKWVRRMWWVPQSASFVSSLFCGAHNLNFR